MTLPFFKFKPDAWLTGNIRFLTPQEQGIFITICALIWKHGGTYEIDAFTHRHLNTSQQVLNDCLQVLNDGGFVLNNDGILSVDFISEQMEHVEKDRLKKSRAGKVSAQKRAQSQQVSTIKNKIKSKSKSKSKSKKADIKKSAFAPFVFLSDDEYRTLIDKFGSEQTAKSAIDTLNNYKASSGKKYKSDYHALIGWVFEKFSAQSQSPIIQKQPPVDDRETRQYGLLD